MCIIVLSDFEFVLHSQFNFVFRFEFKFEFKCRSQTVFVGRGFSRDIKSLKNGALAPDSSRKCVTHAE